MKTVKRKTQPTLTRNVRKLTQFAASLIVENDRLAAEVARLTGKKAPPTFLRMIGR